MYSMVGKNYRDQRLGHPHMRQSLFIFQGKDDKLMPLVLKTSNHKDLFPILSLTCVGITPYLGATQDHIDFE